MVDFSRFRQEVYAVVASISKGKVLSYGQVARLVGMPSHSRQVGRVLSEVPCGHHLPCHRVVDSRGRTAPNWPAQAALLRAEGVVFRRNGCVDMKACGWDWESLADG